MSRLIADTLNTTPEALRGIVANAIEKGLVKLPRPQTDGLATNIHAIKQRYYRARARARPKAKPTMTSPSTEGSGTL